MTTASPLSRGADATKIRAPDKHAYPGPSTAFISSSPVLRLVGRSFAGEKLIAAHALVASEKFFRHANDPHHIDPTAYLEKLLTQASPDLMREMLGDFINQILSTQADAVCDADYGTTSGNRVNHRNGYRRRPLDTRVGTVDVAIPKLGPDPQMVDTLKPASRWGSEVPFHHATQDLHRAVQARRSLVVRVDPRSNAQRDRLRSRGQPQLPAHLARRLRHRHQNQRQR